MSDNKFPIKLGIRHFIDAENPRGTLGTIRDVVAQICREAERVIDSGDDVVFHRLEITMEPSFEDHVTHELRGKLWIKERES